MHERIRSVRYEKVHDTFFLTVLIETKAPSMSMMKKEISLDTVQVSKITMKMKNENDAAVGGDDDEDDSDDDWGFWKV